MVLLLAAGEGARLERGEPKAFVELAGVSLVRRAMMTASRADLVDSLVVAVPAGARDRALKEVSSCGPVTVIEGGETRQDSAALALRSAPSADAYLVHDAARPLAPASLFDACLRELDECDAVVVALPSRDTIKETVGDHVVRTLDRSALVAVQTPQGFRAEVYRRAHEAAARDGFAGTDDASLVERLGVRVRIVPGDDRNMKVTTTADIAVAEALLGVER